MLGATCATVRVGGGFSWCSLCPTHAIADHFSRWFIRHHEIRSSLPVVKKIRLVALVTMASTSRTSRNWFQFLRQKKLTRHESPVAPSDPQESLPLDQIAKFESNLDVHVAHAGPIEPVDTVTHRQETKVSENGALEDAMAGTVTASHSDDENVELEVLELWRLAYERAAFSDEQSAVFTKPMEGESNSWSPLRFVEEVKQLTGNQYAPYKNKDLEADGMANRSAINQRARTVLTAVLELRELVGAGLKFDAIGYGATAWSIITFGLQVCNLLRVWPFLTGLT